MPIAVSHGEGRVELRDADHLSALQNSGTVAVKFVDHYGVPTERYPLNPNGSPGGITGLTLACSLARHGVAAVLLDEDNTVGVKGASSRGICYTQKSLEIFHRLGIYERIAAKGIQWSVGRTFAGDDEVYSFDLRQQSAYNLSSQPPFINIQQFYIEAFLVDRIQALGTARANESVTLTAKTAETVARVNFSDGQSVEAGAVLVELTDRAEVAQLKEAQAAYVETEKQYDRLRGLVKQGTVTQSQVDQQLGARDSARARMEAIRVRLSDRVITAPFAGVLGFRTVSPGALVQPGTVITTLDDVRTIKLDFSVPETFLAALAVGQHIEALAEVAHAPVDVAAELTHLDRPRTGLPCCRRRSRWRTKE